MMRRRGWSVRRSRHALAAAALVAFAGGGASGQTLENIALARTFGAGVHAYFSGAYDRTYDDMTAVIEAGSEDPRALYFRGLAALRMGRFDEAEADFAAGADLEARARGSWRVSPTLERVQGSDRLQLERHRVRARVAALQQDRARERKRYSGIADAQGDVLRRMRPDDRTAEPGGTFAAEDEIEARPTRPAAAPEPESMPEPVVPGGSGADPAAPGEELEAERVEEEPAVAEPAAGDVGEGMEAEQPATPDGTIEPAEPAEPMEPAEPAGPVDPAEPAEPAEPVEPAMPGDPAEPAAAGDVEADGEQPAGPMAEDGGAAAGGQ